jgi:hypothetical protein
MPLNRKVQLEVGWTHILFPVHLFIAVPGIKPRALLMRGKHSATPSPLKACYKIYLYKYSNIFKWDRWYRFHYMIQSEVVLERTSNANSKQMFIKALYLKETK